MLAMLFWIAAADIVSHYVGCRPMEGCHFEDGLAGLTPVADR